MEEWRAEQQRQQTNAWTPGQRILNSTGARLPEHTFRQPVPIAARIVWADDGEEYIETVALGWLDRPGLVRALSDTRYRLTSSSLRRLDRRAVVRVGEVVKASVLRCQQVSVRAEKGRGHG